MDAIHAAAYILLMLPQGALVESRVVDRGHPGFLLHPARRLDEHPNHLQILIKSFMLIAGFPLSHPYAGRYCTLLYRNNRLYQF
ncbi:hypothetical protein [Desulfatitalea tepidiphila]|uniref:hypothetical protein n=1 Tax=Desulfatitalea tepidiphila TaxID=1185843 RepID=UPI00128F6814|nr:hypothetical protein [Desulfatitalea tepidiphila]